MAGAAELRRELLRLLETDEEFRYAVAGKLGLLEVLRRLDRIEGEIARLREDFNKLYQKSLEHDKRFEALERKLLEYDKRFEVLEKKLLEHDKRFEAIEKKLLEHDKRFEALERKLLEHDKRFEAIEKKLLEHDKRFEIIEKKLLEHDKRFEAIEHRLEEHDRKFNKILEEIKKIWETLVEQGRRISRVELELGALAESFYSKALWDELREEIAGRGERILYRKRNFRIDESDIDLYVETDKTIYIAEIKVKPKHEDIGRLLAKADLVRERSPGKEVVAILAGTLIGREVEEYAIGKGVRVYTY